MIDICIVTKNGKLPKGLGNIPDSNIIIETSKPLGIARMNAIKKVTTDKFIFVDDDIIIGEDWYKTITALMNMDDKIGAVYGSVRYEGLSIFTYVNKSTDRIKELKIGERMYTSNCLIKTDIVRDWKPTTGLNCYEDYDLGNYIMRKGYKVYKAPLNAIHKKGLIDVAKNCVWAGKTFREGYAIERNKIYKEYVKRILAPFLSLGKGILLSIYIAYFNLFFIIGLIKGDEK